MEHESFYGDFRSMFLDALRTALTVPALQDEFVAVFDRCLAQRTLDAPPDISPVHVESTALLAAALDALTEGGDNDAMTTLGRVIDAYGAEITRYTRAELDAAADPFQRIVAESRTRETNYFGGDFQFERPRDDANAYHLHITGCAYARIFNSWGLPQLTALFCRLDEAWIRAIEPARHGVAFSRPMTIGWGAERCLFLFDRTGDEPKSR